MRARAPISSIRCGVMRMSARRSCSSAISRKRPRSPIVLCDSTARRLIACLPLLPSCVPAHETRDFFCCPPCRIRRTVVAPGPARIRDVLERTGILLVLGVLVVVFALREPAFLNLDNLFSILQAVSIVALLGIGVTVTLAAGGFDLSVGSVAATAQMAASYVLVVWHGSAWAAVLACVVLGVAAGLFNGLLITRLRVPDQLATLGTLFLLAGLQLIPTGGRSLATGSVLPTARTRRACSRCVSRARPVARVRRRTVAGAAARGCDGAGLRDDGGDPLGPRDLRDRRQRDGRASGRRAAARYRVAAYVVSGAIASLGGVLIAARVGRGDVSAGHSLLLDAVAAALIGYAVWGAKRQRIRHGRRGGVRRCAAQRTHDAERTLLHAGFHQGRTARAGPCIYVRHRSPYGCRA